MDEAKTSPSVSAVADVQSEVASGLNRLSGGRTVLSEYGHVISLRCAQRNVVSVKRDLNRVSFLVADKSLLESMRQVGLDPRESEGDSWYYLDRLTALDVERYAATLTRVMNAAADAVEQKRG